jgi:phosphate transport system substrate-binding protein
MKKTLLIAAIAASTTMTAQFASAARDYISIVGSSTVYPFSTVVAERFGKAGTFKTPKVESTGTGGGFKLFCQGVGEQHPDMANASRAIKPAEFEMCQANGVKDIVEVNVGFDGIVIGSTKSAQNMELSLRDIYLALAAKVPNPNGKEELIANPYKTWKDVNAALPANKIEVLGPPPTSGTRDAFAEMALEGGCSTIPFVKAMKDTDKSAFEAACMTVREDGAYIEAGENDNLIVQKLNSNPNALGIFGFSFLEQNSDTIQAAKIGGKDANFENIADGSYPIARPLFFYVKSAHAGVIPGIKEFVAEFTTDKAFGDEGYLLDKGLIPLPAEKRKAVQADAQAMKSMSL